MAKAPWTSGPGEILQHAVQLLAEDSDANRRLAMILIDNAVELTIKTYLSLPRRVTGLKLSRQQFESMSESFPALLDALEQHVAEKVAGLNLGEIEWYHRLRNELYHQGNGLTVEREKVEVYSELAKHLFRALFGEEIPAPRNKRTQSVGEFLNYWTDFERQTQWSEVKPQSISQWFTSHAGHEKEVRTLRNVRNRLVHGEPLSDEELHRAIKQLEELLRKNKNKKTDE